MGDGQIDVRIIDEDGDELNVWERSEDDNRPVGLAIGTGGAVYLNRKQAKQLRTVLRLINRKAKAKEKACQP